MTTNRPNTIGLALALALVLAGAIMMGFALFGPKKVLEANAPEPAQVYSSTDPDTYQQDTNATWKSTIVGPRVTVPALKLEAPLTKTNEKDGYLDLPKPPRAAWYEQTVPLDADQGRTVIASHVDSGYGDAAPFSRLHNIEKGTPVVVRDFNGVEHTFKAVSIKLYERQDVPDSIFDVNGKHQLVLMTCSGPTIESGRAAHYLYNLVVIADPA